MHKPRALLPWNLEPLHTALCHAITSRPLSPHVLPYPRPQVVPSLASDPEALSLLAGLLTYDPKRRLTARQALAHPWFQDVATGGAAVPWPATGLRAAAEGATEAAAAAALAAAAGVAGHGQQGAAGGAAAVMARGGGVAAGLAGAAAGVSAAPTATGFAWAGSVMPGPGGFGGTDLAGSMIPPPVPGAAAAAAGAAAGEADMTSQ